MSIRIALDHQPEFYTNLDFVAGRIILGLNRAEQVGSIVVKLEGEAVTALQVPPGHTPTSQRPGAAGIGPPGSLVSENHKILYKVQQVFPDEYHSSSSNPYGAFPLNPGEHQFPFKFKLPINNACSNPMAMSKIGGLAGVGGFGSGGGLFGMGGVRVMDGSKQLFMNHVTRTLPPSLTGYPMEAEIRYYIKVTIQRPGFLKENWRFQIGFKFLPIEPPRPKTTGQETFARRPFTFRLPTPSVQESKGKGSFFGIKGGDHKGEPSTTDATSSSPAPSVEVSARLPHPCILTCNQAVPLRLIAKRLVDNSDQLYIVSFEMNLIGVTEIKARGLVNKKINRWVVVANPTAEIPLNFAPDDGVGKEFVIPDELWKNKSLPNTVAPSFATCNLSRKYELEIKVGLAWGKPKTGLRSKASSSQPQAIYLPLHFAQVEVHSGISPPPELLAATQNSRPGRASLDVPPRLPPRVPSAGPSTSTPLRRPVPAPRPSQDPLYPPQLAPGQVAPPGQEAPPGQDAPPVYEEAPPSYDEAVAENLSGPFDGLQQRPAYSGVTNENAPSQMPAEKN